MKLKENDVVMVIANKSYHCYEIGDIVVVHPEEDNLYRMESYSSPQWCEADEVCKIGEL